VLDVEEENDFAILCQTPANRLKKELSELDD